MGPIRATASCMRRPFTFAGRASRSEFWWFTLFYILISGVVLSFVAWPLILLLVQVDMFEAQGGTAPLASPQILARVEALQSSLWVAGMLMVLPFFAGLSVTVRRLHDIGRSGWWYWVGLVPFVGGIILLIFLVLPGESQTNSYGPAPTKDGASEKAAKPTTRPVAKRKAIPRGLPGEPYNPVNELTTADELRALRQSRMQPQ